MTYEIKKYHGNYNRTRKSGSYKYIVIHYTSTNASALNNCKYFAGGNRNASAHYFIDDANIYEYLDPSQYYSWAVGDGKGRYGITNSNSINIEVCRDNRAFTAGEIDRLTYLVQYLMKKYGISASNIVRHYDASRKSCPAYYVNASRWNALKAQITGGKVSGSTTTTTTTTTTTNAATTGKAAIREVQTWLNDNYGSYIKKTVGALLAVDGIFGAKTKKALVTALQVELNKQFGKGLAVDGIFGAKTKAACVNVKQGAKGNLTKTLQGALICRGYSTNGFDGIFGSGTKSAVKSFQKAKGLSADGIAGKNTFAALLG